jgi:hypothetical protein
MFHWYRHHIIVKLGVKASFIVTLTGATEKVKFEINESWESKYAHIFMYIDRIYHINWHVLRFPKVLHGCQYTFNEVLFLKANNKVN